jgi:predicted nucleic acid-binding protein
MGEKVKIALSTPLILEYDEVLKRNHILAKLKMTASQIEDVIDLLVMLANKHLVYYRLRPNLLDENDNMLVECAFVSGSQYLITSNIKDFTRGELQIYPFTVITPGNFYYLWRREYE